MRFHFIGICGAGMSAVAKLLIEQGHSVTGSDEGFYPPISDYLKANAIPCATPFSKSNIPEDTDFIVIGKHAKLVPEENEEVAAAFSSNKKIISFPEALAMITKGRHNIVVAGSFGKSTCTSLIAWCLEDNGAGYFIGALPLTPKENARLGQGELFIVEGDEYPSANWDRTSKFLYYNPRDVLLTALAHDHVNVFATHADYIEPFEKMISGLPEDGLLVACIDDKTIRERMGSWQKKCITYGFSQNAMWRAENISWGDKTTFDLVRDGVIVVSLATTLLGKHNVENIVGVSAFLLEKGYVTPEELKEKIATFEGIVRRLDKKSHRTSLPIYEGFGSSIDKARSAIEAIRLHFPDRRLVIVFEPHTFSWRNRQAITWYDTVFSGAKKVFIYKPPEHGSETHDQLSLEEIVSRVRGASIDAIGIETVQHGKSLILDTLENTDVVLILSSGGMDGLMQELVSHVEQKFPLH